MEDLIEKRTQIIAICFGLMAKSQTSANLMELNVMVRFAI
jgi:hypothetical protein